VLRAQNWVMKERDKLMSGIVQYLDDKGQYCPISTLFRSTFAYRIVAWSSAVKKEHKQTTEIRLLGLNAASTLAYACSPIQLRIEPRVSGVLASVLQQP
jgi:hypothetical protein